MKLKKWFARIRSSLRQNRITDRLKELGARPQSPSTTSRRVRTASGTRSSLEERTERKIKHTIAESVAKAETFGHQLGPILSRIDGLDERYFSECQRCGADFIVKFEVPEWYTSDHGTTYVGGSSLRRSCD